MFILVERNEEMKKKEEIFSSLLTLEERNALYHFLNSGAVLTAVAISMQQIAQETMKL